MNRLKIIIANFLKHSFFGYIVAWAYDNKIPFKKTTINTRNPLIDNSIKAALFWGLYESAEIRFINEYLSNGVPVIELGSSIGVVACQLGRFTDDLIICVEANPGYKQIIEENLMLNKVTNYKVYSAAIATPQQNPKWFSTSRINTSGKLQDNLTQDSIIVPTVELSNILNENDIGEYTLVCDIEGGEADILQNDYECLINCRQMIIELHSTQYENRVFRPIDLHNIIMNRGFDLKDSYGNVMVYENVSFKMS